jgi:hypothetical protein
LEDARRAWAREGLLAQVPYFDELGIKSSAAICQDYDNLILDELEKVLEQVGDFQDPGQHLPGG